jgi:transcriptional regulator with XRE-family HTH domain
VTSPKPPSLDSATSAATSAASVAASAASTATSALSSAIPSGADIGTFIREQRQHAKLSLRRLAQDAGVSNPYLSQIERGLRRPSAEILQQLAKGLRISAEQLYVQAGLLEDRGTSQAVEAAIVSDPTINERQKRVLLDIYASFIAENRVAEHVDASTDGSTEPVKSTPAKRSAARATKKSARNSAKAGKTAAKKSATKKSASKKSASTSGRSSSSTTRSKKSTSATSRSSH